MTSQSTTPKGTQPNWLTDRMSPIMTNSERVKLLRGCKWVDRAIKDLPYFVDIDLLDKHKIDVILHGDDIIYNEQGESTYTQFEKVGRFK